LRERLVERRNGASADTGELVQWANKGAKNRRDLLSELRKLELTVINGTEQMFNLNAEILTRSDISNDEREPWRKMGRVEIEVFQDSDWARQRPQHLIDALTKLQEFSKRFQKAISSEITLQAHSELQNAAFAVMEETITEIHREKQLRASSGWNTLIQISPVVQAPGAQRSMEALQTLAASCVNLYVETADACLEQVRQQRKQIQRMQKSSAADAMANFTKLRTMLDQIETMTRHIVQGNLGNDPQDAAPLAALRSSLRHERAKILVNQLRLGEPPELQPKLSSSGDRLKVTVSTLKRKTNSLLPKQKQKNMQLGDVYEQQVTWLKEWTEKFKATLLTRESIQGRFAQTAASSTKQSSEVERLQQHAIDATRTELKEMQRLIEWIEACNKRFGSMPATEQNKKDLESKFDFDREELTARLKQEEQRVVNLSGYLNIPIVPPENLSPSQPTGPQSRNLSDLPEVCRYAICKRLAMSMKDIQESGVPITDLRNAKDKVRGDPFFHDPQSNLVFYHYESTSGPRLMLAGLPQLQKSGTPEEVILAQIKSEENRTRDNVLAAKRAGTYQERNPLKVSPMDATTVGTSRAKVRGPAAGKTPGM